MLLIKTQSISSLYMGQGSFYSIVVNILDCDIVASEFEFQLHYYAHIWTNTLRKGMKPLTLPVMGLIVSLLFYKDGFGIK